MLTPAIQLRLILSYRVQVALEHAAEMAADGQQRHLFCRSPRGRILHVNRRPSMEFILRENCRHTARTHHCPLRRGRTFRFRPNELQSLVCAFLPSLFLPCWPFVGPNSQSEGFRPGRNPEPGTLAVSLLSHVWRSD